LDKDPSYSLDDLDLRILSVLSEDVRKSYREVARNLDVSSGTVYNRIKKMTDKGVIKGYVPLVDHGKLGYVFTVLILIQVEGKHLAEVEEKLAKPNEVLSVYDITGEFDVAVIARFKNTESMNSFIKNTLKIPHIRRTVTNVVLNIVKEDLRIRT
jgi:Lrp/AsnC family transcriptional regulator for asnA, asnC and gidA